MQAHTTYNVFIYISVHACVCVGDEWADFPCFFLFCSPLSQTHTRQDKAKGGAGSWLKSLLFWPTDFLFQAAMTPIAATQLCPNWTGIHTHKNGSFIFNHAQRLIPVEHLVISCTHTHNYTHWLALLHKKESYKHTDMEVHAQTHTCVLAWTTCSLMPYINQMSRNL